VGEKGNGLGEGLGKNADPTGAPGSLAKFLDGSDKLGGVGKLDGGVGKLEVGLGTLDGGGLDKPAGGTITDGRPADRGPADSGR
jgi:hypothetical protein